MSDSDKNIPMDNVKKPVTAECYGNSMADQCQQDEPHSSSMAPKDCMKQYAKVMKKAHKVQEDLQKAVDDFAKEMRTKSHQDKKKDEKQTGRKHSRYALQDISDGTSSGASSSRSSSSDSNMEYVPCHGRRKNLNNDDGHHHDHRNRSGCRNKHRQYSHEHCRCPCNVSSRDRYPPHHGIFPHHRNSDYYSGLPYTELRDRCDYRPHYDWFLHHRDSQFNGGFPCSKRVEEFPANGNFFQYGCPLHYSGNHGGYQYFHSVPRFHGVLYHPGVSHHGMCKLGQIFQLNGLCNESKVQSNHLRDHSHPHPRCRISSVPPYFKYDECKSKLRHCGSSDMKTYHDQNKSYFVRSYQSGHHKLCDRLKRHENRERSRSNSLECQSHNEIKKSYGRCRRSRSNSPRHHSKVKENRHHHHQYKLHASRSNSRGRKCHDEIHNNGQHQRHESRSRSQSNSASRQYHSEVNNHHGHPKHQESCSRSRFNSPERHPEIEKNSHHGNIKKHQGHCNFAPACLNSRDCQYYCEKNKHCDHQKCHSDIKKRKHEGHHEGHVCHSRSRSNSRRRHGHDEINGDHDRYRCPASHSCSRSNSRACHSPSCFISGTFCKHHDHHKRRESLSRSRSRSRYYSCNIHRGDHQRHAGRPQTRSNSRERHYHEKINKHNHFHCNTDSSSPRFHFRDRYDLMSPWMRHFNIGWPSNMLRCRFSELMPFHQQRGPFLRCY